MVDWELKHTLDYAYFKICPLFDRSTSVDLKLELLRVRIFLRVQKARHEEMDPNRYRHQINKLGLSQKANRVALL